MSDIFLSYKREDRRHAKSLAEALQKAGWSVWWDPQLRSGERFDDAIERELKSAKCVIVVWSIRSVGSQYVRDEAAYALRLNKLIPVTIEDVELPFRYERLQTESLAGWKGSQAFPAFKKILDDIASVIGGGPVKSRKRREAIPSSTKGLALGSRRLKSSKRPEVIASSTKRAAVGGGPVKSRKRREAIPSSTKGLALGSRRLKSSKRPEVIASSTKRAAVGGPRVKSRKRREAIPSSTKGLAVGSSPVKSRRRPEMTASSTKRWTERNEGILFDALRKLMREGTPQGFLMAAVGYHYVQFVRDVQGDPRWLFAETVSNKFLPARLRLTKASADLLVKMGFEKQGDYNGNFHRHYQINNDDDLINVARSVVMILRDVYGVTQSSNLDITLDL